MRRGGTCEGRSKEEDARARDPAKRRTPTKGGSHGEQGTEQRGCSRPAPSRCVGNGAQLPSVMDPSLAGDQGEVAAVGSQLETAAAIGARGRALCVRGLVSAEQGARRPERKQREEEQRLLWRKQGEEDGGVGFLRRGMTAKFTTSADAPASVRLSAAAQAAAIQPSSPRFFCSSLAGTNPTSPASPLPGAGREQNGVGEAGVREHGEGEREDEAGGEQREGAQSHARDRRRDADQLLCAQRREVARLQVHRRRRDAACVGRPGWFEEQRMNSMAARAAALAFAATATDLDRGWGVAAPGREGMSLPGGDGGWCGWLLGASVSAGGCGVERKETLL
jgi:hypothetical protein